MSVLTLGLTRELPVELVLTLDLPDVQPPEPAPWLPAAVQALLAFRQTG